MNMASSKDISDSTLEGQFVQVYYVSITCTMCPKQIIIERILKLMFIFQICHENTRDVRIDPLMVI